MGGRPRVTLRKGRGPKKTIPHQKSLMEANPKNGQQKKMEALRPKKSTKR